MDFARMNIDNLLLKPINGSLLSDVSTFFQDSNIYHVPIFGSIGVMIILVLCIPCMICLCCPACCAPLCYICGGNRNPIVIHHARLQDKKRHKAMIKHFGSPPASDSTPPLLGPRRSSTEAHEHLLIHMKRLERQQLRTLSEPLLPSAPPAQTSFSNLEYLAQPTYDPAMPGLE